MIFIICLTRVRPPTSLVEQYLKNSSEVLMIFHVQIRSMFNMKLFIDTDADSRLSKRVLKDVDELGRDLDQVSSQLICIPIPILALFPLFLVPHPNGRIWKGNHQKNISFPRDQLIHHCNWDKVPILSFINGRFFTSISTMWSRPLRSSVCQPKNLQTSLFHEGLRTSKIWNQKKKSKQAADVLILLMIVMGDIYL